MIADFSFLNIDEQVYDYSLAVLGELVQENCTNAARKLLVPQIMKLNNFQDRQKKTKRRSVTDGIEDQAKPSPIGPKFCVLTGRDLVTGDKTVEGGGLI